MEVYDAEYNPTDYVKIGTHVFSSEDSLADKIRDPNKQAVAEDAFAIASYSKTLAIMTTSGKIRYIDNSGGYDEGVSAVYVDGDDYFGIRITADSDFFCNEHALDVCPDAKAIPETVHEVASANLEGLVLRLKSGALYYKRNDEWIVDEEAMQVGIFKGSLFRLLKNGTILRDGEVVGDGKHSLLVTDS